MKSLDKRVFAREIAVVKLQKRIKVLRARLRKNIKEEARIMAGILGNKSGQKRSSRNRRRTHSDLMMGQPGVSAVLQTVETVEAVVEA